MEEIYNYKEFAVLYVDDEDKSLKYFKKVFEDKFRVLTASNAEDAFRLLEKHKDEIGILITDQRMPGSTGVQLLEKSRKLCSRILRILVTAYSDPDATIEAINSGAIYKYISKPWDVLMLEATLQRGMEFFIVQREKDQLLKEKMDNLHKMMMTDRLVGLGILAGGLGHHLHNSLVAVKTFLDLAPVKLQAESIDLEHLHDPNYWNHFYQIAQDQIKKSVDLLTDLDRIPKKPESDFLEGVNLIELINHVIQDLKPKFIAKAISFENQLPASLPILSVDRLMFYRLFKLLFEDQLTSLSTGNRLVVRARTNSSSQRNEGNEIILELEDDGPGLPEESLRCLFDPFFVRKDNPSAYGINLLTCYFIVYHHNGTMKAENLAKGGTLFTLTFPINLNPTLIQSHEKTFLEKVFFTEKTLDKLLVDDAPRKQ